MRNVQTNFSFLFFFCFRVWSLYRRDGLTDGRTRCIIQPTGQLHNKKYRKKGKMAYSVITMVTSVASLVIVIGVDDDFCANIVVNIISSNHCRTCFTKISSKGLTQFILL